MHNRSSINGIDKPPAARSIGQYDARCDLVVRTTLHGLVATTTAKLFEVLSGLPDCTKERDRALQWLHHERINESRLGAIPPEKRAVFTGGYQLRPNSLEVAVDITAHILLGLLYQKDRPDQLW